MYISVYFLNLIIKKHLQKYFFAKKIIKGTKKEASLLFSSHFHHLLIITYNKNSTIHLSKHSRKRAS